MKAFPEASSVRDDLGTESWLRLRWVAVRQVLQPSTFVSMASPVS